MDDPAKWPAHTIDEAWNHARASCRIGLARCAVATTFRGTPTLRRLLKKGDLHGLVYRDLSVFDNFGNLSHRMRNSIDDMDEEFRRREIEGIDDSANSPFAGIDFDKVPVRLLELPREEIDEVVVAVDPAEGKGAGHDLWGIGAAARRHDRHVVALEDKSGSYDDDEGASAALDLCETWGAHKIVVEDNRGPRVSNALKAVWYERQSKGRTSRIAMPEIVGVTAKEKKKVRAGPVRPLYLRGMAHHLPGLGALEKQQREWDPDAPPRPQQDDRIDWLVHAFFYLAGLERELDWAPPVLPPRLPGAEEQRAGGSGVSMDWLRQRSPGASSSMFGRGR
jgi:phage terminase large subunit-like protein